MRPALRDTIFEGKSDPEGRAAFLGRSDAESLRRWFGEEACAALRDMPERVADFLGRDIAALDDAIAGCLDRVLHDRAFQKFESAWRGVQWLVSQIPPGQSIQVKLLPASWRDLAGDFSRNAMIVDTPQGPQKDVGRTALYALVYQREYNQAGGKPFGLLLVDHEVAAEPVDGDPTDDIDVLESLAQVALLSFAPVVVAVAPEFLVEGPAPDGFGHLAGVANPADIIGPGAASGGAGSLGRRRDSYRRFRELRRQPASRFVAMVMPRALARPPWTDDATRNDGFRYREDAADIASRCWMTACFPFASVVIRAAAKFGWPADICGSDAGRIGGGIVTGLPAEPFRLGARFSLPRVPMDVVWLESQERDTVGGEANGLVPAGFSPLSPRPFGIEPAFGASRSLFDMSAIRNRTAFADVNVASQFNAVLCASRFAHTIKVRGRDMVASLQTADAIEAEMWEWVRPYINVSPTASAELRAKSPLVEAKVSVQELSDRPGNFVCQFKLRPYYQLESIAPEFSFQTELGQPTT
jgi:type VI secretion system ImpC/EvpB family protein